MAEKTEYRYWWEPPKGWWEPPEGKRWIPWPKANDKGNAKLLFIMLNPSTAKLNSNKSDRCDHTTRKVCGYAYRWGYRCVGIVNLYAAMTKDYKELKKMADPVGPKNDEELEKAIDWADKIICAWGVEKKGPEGRDRVSKVWEMIKKSGKKSCALKINKDDSPAHPLARGLSYSVELKPYAPPWAAEI